MSRGEVKNLVFASGVSVTAATQVFGNIAVDTVWVAATTKDVDVSVYNMDARYCGVEVLENGSSYVTADFQITRPDANTVRLTSGIALTGTFRVILTEGEVP